MEILITVMIIAGAMLMIANICRYISFLYSTRDVLLIGKKRDIFWKNLALVPALPPTSWP